MISFEIMFTGARKLLELERPGCWREGMYMRWHSESHFLSRHFRCRKMTDPTAQTPYTKHVWLKHWFVISVVFLVWGIQTWINLRMQGPKVMGNTVRWATQSTCATWCPCSSLCAYRDLRGWVYHGIPFEGGKEVGTILHTAPHSLEGQHCLCGWVYGLSKKSWLCSSTRRWLYRFCGSSCWADSYTNTIPGIRVLGFETPFLSKLQSHYLRTTRKVNILLLGDDVIPFCSLETSRDFTNQLRNSVHIVTFSVSNFCLTKNISCCNSGSCLLFCFQKE